MNEEYTLKEELKAAKQEQASRTILLTSRSNANILNNIKKLQAKLSRKATVKKLEVEKKDLEEFKENASLEQKDIETVEKAIKGLEDVITIISAEDLINKDSHIKQVDAKPIKLVNKMFNPIKTTFNYYYKKITNKIVDKVQEQHKKMDSVDKKEDVEIQVVTDFERSMEENKMAKEETKVVENKEEYELPKDFNSFEARLSAAIEEAIKEEEAKKEKEENEITKERVNEIAEDFKEAGEKIKPYNFGDSKSLDINEIKQNYINVVNKVKEQNENLEKKEAEIRRAEEAKKQAEEAKKQALDKLIQQTIAQQNKLAESMERESKLNMELAHQEQETERINRETEELLFMLGNTVEDKETKEKAK